MNTSVESNVWGRVLHSLESKLNQQALETWFRPIEFERLDSSEHVIHLRVPNQIVRDWVVNNYAQALDESLTEQLLGGYSVGWVIGKALESVPAVESPDQKLTFDAAVAASINTPPDVSAAVNQAPAILINEPSLDRKSVV